MNLSDECRKRFLLEKEYLSARKRVNQVPPVVSVTVITYQHRDYIAGCLDGILMQKTSFPFEIIIGEDESTDGTREICMEYAKKNPDKIRLFLRSRNTSQYYDDDGKFVTRFNGIWNRMSTRGKFVAWCEGDDYWTDPYKLQRQVDFLETNPDHGLVFTDCSLSYQESGRFVRSRYEKEIIHVGRAFEKLLEKNFIATPTVCARRDLVLKGNELIILHPHWVMGDYPMWLEISRHAQIGFLNKVTAVHRFLRESASRTRDVHKRLRFIESDFEVKEYFMNRYNLSSKDSCIAKVYNQKLLLTALEYRNPSLVESHYKGDIAAVSLLDRLYILGARNGLFWLLVKFIRFIVPKLSY